MPNITLTLPNLTQSVFRPIVIDIVEQVKHTTKISNTTEVFFLNHNGQALAAGTSVDNIKDRYARFGSERKVMIEAEEYYNTDGLTTTVIERSENLPIFYDKSLELIVRPAYMPSDLQIRFKFLTNSKEEAQRWSDDIATRVNMMREMFLHTITYHYTVPVPIWEVIQEVYNKREAIAGYGQSLSEYVASNASPDLTLLGNQTGSERSLAISQTQAEVIGLFDFSPVPEKAAYIEDKGMWEASFVYRLTYNRPVAMNMKYPIVVHNQLLDSDFIKFVNADYKPEDVAKSMNNSTHALYAFRNVTIQNRVTNPHPYFRIPSVDDYQIKNTPPGSGTVALVLLNLDPDALTTIFNLKEMGDVHLDRDVLDWIAESETPYIGKLYQSFFQVHMYCNNNLTGEASLSCNQNLDLVSMVAMDLRKAYRIRLSLITDPTKLPWQAVERLANNPKAFVKVLSAINEILATTTHFQALGDLKRIEPYHLSQIWRAVTGSGLNSGTRGSITPIGAPGMDWGLAPGSNYGLNAANNRGNNQGNSLFGIPEYIWNNYRNARKNSMTVMTSGIMVAGHR